MITFRQWSIDSDVLAGCKKEFQMHSQQTTRDFVSHCERTMGTFMGKSPTTKARFASRAVNEIFFFFCNFRKSLLKHSTIFSKRSIAGAFLLYCCKLVIFIVRWRFVVFLSLTFVDFHPIHSVFNKVAKASRKRVLVLMKCFHLLLSLNFAELLKKFQVKQRFRGGHVWHRELKSCLSRIFSYLRSLWWP